MNGTLLDVQNLTIRFGGLCALDNVSFQIAPGEIVGIIGPNGAGKTTMFNSLVGIQRLTGGSIHFSGEAVTNLRPHRVAKAGMTKTFQNAALFPDMSVRENVITAALIRHNLAGAKKVADAAIERLGLMAIADQDVGTLTFPQKAMVELTRALATEPKLLLLDEVMAALTQTEMDEIIAVIRRLRDEGLTFLVVEHHMRAIMALCDRLIVLTFGKLITQGAPEEVVRNPDVIRAYLGSTKPGKEQAHA
jgi:branched-chain amino acid transport system ATP-binding protein